MMKLEILVVEVFDGLTLIIGNETAHKHSEKGEPFSPSCEIFEFFQCFDQTFGLQFCVNV